MSESQLKKRKLVGSRRIVKRSTEERVSKFGKNLFGKNVFQKNLWKYFLYSMVALPLVGVSTLIFSQSPIDAKEYSLPEPPEWNGPLAPNSRLTKAELLFQNQIYGPESLLIDDENGIVTGTSDGRIIRIKNGTIMREIRLGKEPCATLDVEPTCGRPLGLRWSSKKTIIVADAYLGLYDVDLNSGEFHQMVAGGQMVDGRPLTILNDVEVLKNGTILFTDSSSKWDMRKFIFHFMEGSGSGRLLSYCPETKKVRVLIDNLFVPNGVQLSKDQDYLLINEFAKARILKYYLKGPNSGTYKVFLDNMPGLPDNIRMSHNGTYWVGMPFIRRRGTFNLWEALGPYPFIRNLLTKVFAIKRLAYLMDMSSPNYGLIVQVDTNGNYVSSLHDPSGKQVPSVSEVHDDGTALYLGSFHSKFIAKVNI